MTLAVLQYINKSLHDEPLSFLFYGIFWSFILIILSPIFGIALLLQTTFKALHSSHDKKFNAKMCGKELAVFITGCDSGFGKGIAFKLSERGFVVFAGCLTEEGMQQYQGISSILPFRVDITKKEDLMKVSTAISKWILDENKKMPRFLHALINNAGIGNGGCIDWIEMEDFRKAMEVNYFGTIQTTKCVLPILKSQASSGNHTNARIINMVSAAGLAAMKGFAPYNGSKFATEAFSTCLRLELKAFDLFVTTVNPSFHKTPMVENMGIELDNRWKKVREDTRKEYGEEFFAQEKKNAIEHAENTMWDANIVVEQVSSCVEMKKPPAQLIIGMDVYGILLLRHLPVWLQDVLFAALPSEKPAMMKR